MPLSEYVALVHAHNKRNYDGPPILSGQAAHSALRSMFGGRDRKNQRKT